MTQPVKNLLCIISKGPFKGSSVVEQIEAAMVGAVFDMKVRILLTGEGIFNGVAAQDGSPLGARSAANILKGLELYDIDEI